MTTEHIELLKHLSGTVCSDRKETVKKHVERAKTKLLSDTVADIAKINADVKQRKMEQIENIDEKSKKGKSVK